MFFFNYFFLHYFRAFGSFLDGGLIANNPTLDMLTEIQEYNSVINALGAGTGIQPMLVVSLGTGCKPTEQVKNLRGKLDVIVLNSV